MAITINQLVKYTSTLLVLVLLTQVKVTFTKRCQLKKHNDGKYFLSCRHGTIPQTESERSPSTAIRKKDKKNKRGPPGEQGPIGPPGKDGRDGKPGPEGPMGPVGPVGVPGPRGNKGRHGPKGARGDSGPMGPQGKAGLPGNCLKEPPKYSEKAKEYYHCLAGPQGPQGNKGDTGPKGKDGKPGPRGEPGHSGATGPRGRRGPVGMPGLPGTAAQIDCQDHFTDWSGENRPTHGFFCPKGHFLQGFERENLGLQERYHYICCSIL